MRKIVRSLVQMILPLLLLVVLFASGEPTVHAQSQAGWSWWPSKYSNHVGAWGDDASVGNTGVRIQIQTNAYDVRNGDVDAFYVGDYAFSNGSYRDLFFGYEIQPGRYCLKGNLTSGWQKVSVCSGSVDSIGQRDARWFWQASSYGYGQTRRDYYQVGPKNSAGENGTWHEYSVEPNSTNYWSFVIDGQTVGTLPFQVTKSHESAFAVAEKDTDSLPLERLGPAAFQNLEYLKEGSWQAVDFLNARTDCWGNLHRGDFCIANNPYGVVANGANAFLAGSQIPQPRDGTVLWADSPVLTLLIPLGYSTYMSNSLSTLGFCMYSSPEGVVPYYSCNSNSSIATTGHAFQSDVGSREVFQLILLNNATSIVLPQTLQLPSVPLPFGVRLEFEGWSDGYTNPNRTSLSSGVGLNATYVVQYELYLVGANGTTVTGTGWYDANSTANFSASDTAPMEGLWGTLGAAYHFQGWYRSPLYESYDLLTSSSSGAIVMNHPSALYAKWSSIPDYTMPGIVITIFVVVIISLALFLVRRRRMRKL